MLSSSVRARVARATIQKRALARISTVRAFVTRASSSGHRRRSPSNHPVSDPSMAHLP